MACSARGPWFCFQYPHRRSQPSVTHVVRTYLRMKHPYRSKISSKPKCEKNVVLKWVCMGSVWEALGSILVWNKTRHGICLESQDSGVGGGRESQVQGHLCYSVNCLRLCPDILLQNPGCYCPSSEAAVVHHKLVSWLEEDLGRSFRPAFDSLRLTARCMSLIQPPRPNSTPPDRASLCSPCWRGTFSI